MSDIIRSKLEEVSDIADELYSSIDRTRIFVPHPQQWLNQQDKMRRMWIYTKQFIHQNREWGNIIDINFVNYMQHMYDNYPAGYGARLRAAHKDDDTALIFLACLENRATNLCSKV